MKRFSHSLAPVDSISSLDEMLIHSDYAVQDGETVWVRSVRCAFVYRIGSGMTPDGISVVGSAFSPGLWVRLPGSSDRSWSSQLSWYIDPANPAASDENTGADAAHPLKTAAEYDRRNSDLTKLVGDYHYYLISNVVFPDYFRLSGIAPDGSVHHVHGSATPGHGKTVLYASVAGITARTAMVEASNIRPAITDAVIPTGTWAGAGFISNMAHTNFRIRFTSGAASGAICWPLKDEGAGKVDTTPLSLAPADLFTGYWSSTLPATVTPSVNDKFVVESLVEVDDLRLEMRPTRNYSGVNVSTVSIFVDSVMTGASLLSASSYGTNDVIIVFWGCVNPVIGNTAGSIFLLASVCPGGFPGIANSAFYWQCGILFPITPNAGGVVNIAKSTMAQGCAVVRCIDGGSANVAQACSFDSVNYGIQVIGEAAGIELENGMDGPACLWGTGAAQTGLHAAPGNTVLHNNGTKVITGAGGDFDLGGAVTARAWDDGTSAYTALRNCTWTLLGTAIAGGGFGSCAHNVQEDAHIVLEVM
jgi:hypothetical protein